VASQEAIMASSSTLEANLQDAQSQIRDLREQLEQVMSNRVQPAMRQAASQASDAMDRARERAQEEADSAADYVRARPLSTVLAAVAIGYIAARILR
jgi:ElaB/YqjD/DUF883 family membrane-anchored ribosome-binding protein